MDGTSVSGCARGVSTACGSSVRHELEEKIVAYISPGFSLNRISGGNFGTALKDIRESGLRKRDLSATDVEWAAYWARLDEPAT
jgi:chorismate synthase